MKKPCCWSILALYFLAGCAFRDDEAGLVLSDSAGVQLVRMTGEFAATVPTLTPREDLRIGAVDGPPEYQFFRITAVGRSGDGALFVLDGGNAVVRVFGPNGEFLREFGSEGEGPGRFDSPYALAMSGDSVVVVDRRLMHLFEADGAFLAASAPHLRPGAYIWKLNATAHGLLVETRSPPSRDREGIGPFIDTAYVQGLDPITGELGSVVFAYPRQRMYRLGPMGFGVTPLFEPLPQHQVDREGKIYYTPGGGYEIEVRDAQGTLRRRATADVPREPIGSDLIDMYLETEGERLQRSWGNRPEGDMARKAYLEDRLALDGPDVRPVLGRLIVSSEGEVLAERLDLNENPFQTGVPTVWDLIGADGVIDGRITLSGRFLPLTLTKQGLLGVLRDEMDVQYLVRYRLDPTE